MPQSYIVNANVTKGQVVQQVASTSAGERQVGLATSGTRASNQIIVGIALRDAASGTVGDFCEPDEICNAAEFAAAAVTPGTHFELTVDANSRLVSTTSTADQVVALFMGDVATPASVSKARVRFVGSAYGDVIGMTAAGAALLDDSTAGDQLTTLGAQAAGDVLDDLNTLGAPTADGEFIVGTGAGVFAYETAGTALASLGIAINNGTTVGAQASLAISVPAGHTFGVANVNTGAESTGGVEDCVVAAGTATVTFNSASTGNTDVAVITW